MEYGFRVICSLGRNRLFQDLDSFLQLFPGDDHVEADLHMACQLGVHIADAGEKSDGGQFPLLRGKEAPLKNIIEKMLFQEGADRRGKLIIETALERMADETGLGGLANGVAVGGSVP